MSLKVSEKGGVSVYGLGASPRPSTTPGARSRNQRRALQGDVGVHDAAGGSAAGDASALVALAEGRGQGQPA
jgi:hypothetical protein